MQEPIEFTLHRTIKAGDMKAALLLSEQLVKNVLFSQWSSGDALATERKARPQAAAGDVPLPLEEPAPKPVEVEVIQDVEISIDEKIQEEAPAPVIQLPAKKEEPVQSLGKPFIGLKEMVDGEVARKLAHEAFRKNRNGKAPLDNTELAQFLGFKDARNIGQMNRGLKFMSHYAEYLSAILGPEVLI